MIQNLEQYTIVRSIEQTSQNLINFENAIIEEW